MGVPVLGSSVEPPSQAVPGGKCATAMPTPPSQSAWPPQVRGVVPPRQLLTTDLSDPGFSVPSWDNLTIKEGKGKKKALDLFCGTGAVGRRLGQLGYEVVSLDINPRTRPTILCDILDWRFSKYPRGYFDVITASVPCQQYSQARTTSERNFEHADAIVKRVLKIIRYFNPGIWWIENPRNGHLKDRPFMQKIPFCDVDYCQFSDWGYKKPTRIWGSEKIAQLPSKLCNPEKCPNMVFRANGKKGHREVLGGNRMRFSPVQKGRFPTLLVDYLLGCGRPEPGGVEKDQPGVRPVLGQPERVPDCVSWARARGRQKLGSEDTAQVGSQAAKVVKFGGAVLHKRRSYRVGRVSFDGEDLQLVLRVPVELSNGEISEWKILVDTGAQANLVRKGLVPDHLMFSATEPLSFRTANGQRLEGGERVTETSLGFRQVVEGHPLDEFLWKKAIFYEADIQVDAILSFPWLRMKKIGVFPHLRALAVAEPHFVLLLGLPSLKKKMVNQVENGNAGKRKKSEKIGELKGGNGWK